MVKAPFCDKARLGALFITLVNTLAGSGLFAGG